MPTRTILALMASMAAAMAAAPASAEQMQRFDDVDVHYMVVNTRFLTPAVAQQYGITRGRDRAMLNVSVIGRDGVPQVAEVTAAYANLLGQRAEIPLTEIREEPAVYYIGQFRYTDQDTLRFTISVGTEAGHRHEVRFQQKMFVESH